MTALWLPRWMPPPTMSPAKSSRYVLVCGGILLCTLCRWLNFACQQRRLSRNIVFRCLLPIFSVFGRTFQNLLDSIRCAVYHALPPRVLAGPCSSILLEVSRESIEGFRYSLVFIWGNRRPDMCQGMSAWLYDYEWGFGGQLGLPVPGYNFAVRVKCKASILVFLSLTPSLA